MLAHGTTTVEAKSGYGLTEKDEIRALALLADLAADPSLPRIVPTLMAAHEIPPEFRGDRAEWVRIVADEIVPGSPARISRASATSSASKGSSPSRSRGESSRRRAGRAWACGCTRTSSRARAAPCWQPS